MNIIDDEYTQSDIYEDSALYPTQRLKAVWVSTGKWALFLSILGFMVTGLVALLTAIIGPTVQMMLGFVFGQSATLDLLRPMFQFITFIMVPVVVVLFMIYLYHVRFATGIQKAIRYNSQEHFEAAWRNLRNYFRLYGIASVVVVMLYLLVMILILTTGGTTAAQPAMPTEF